MPGQQAQAKESFPIHPRALVCSEIKNETASRIQGELVLRSTEKGIPSLVFGITEGGVGEQAFIVWTGLVAF